MTTMSEEGERLCPLCTEEMDLTDQQLKPCKCGYEICVWCWNHIMDMAEKDEAEGRCPACRTPYDKEKIVGATVNCERLAEMNSDRRQKMQKSKTKVSEGRKHLSNVRVIQRNLVYVVGIPPNLADEEVLERKEYFGQYGKVLKVSISRTSAGIPHTTNNTFSVYITYTKEEEAIRCIQAVNGFVLEGRPLRAHYGTTKYCHAWLKNMPCSNPDCLYLHDVGTQEDSFTKDEAISPCIRTKGPQMAGASNHLQRRSGNVLPPSADELCNNGIPISGKVLPKTLASNPLNHITSPPNGNPGRSSALPAAASWGLRAANGKITFPNAVSSQGSGAHKQGLCNGSAISPLAIAVSSSSCVTDELATNLDSGPLRLTAKNNGRNASNVPREVATDSAVTTASTQVPSLASSMSVDSRGITASREHEDSASLLLGKAADGASLINEVPPSLCYASSSSSSNFHLGNGLVSGGKGYNTNFDKRPALEEEMSSDPTRNNCTHEHEFLAYQTSTEAADMPEPAIGQKEINCSRDWEVRALADVAGDKHVSPDNHLGNQHLESSEGLIGHQPSSPPMISEQSVSLSMQNNDSAGAGDRYDLAGKAVTDVHGLSGSLNHEHDFAPLSCTTSNSLVQDNLKNFCSPSDGFGLSSDHFDPGNKVEHARPLTRLENDISSVDKNDYLGDPGESSIISNILSMNLDGADDPLTSAESITKLLSGESCKPLVKPSAARKPINSNQSRFSFARQEEYVGQPGYSAPNRSHAQNSFIMADAGEVRDPSLLNQESIFPTNDRAFLPSNRTAPRAPVSAPPGFVMPTRPPPPGFSSMERMDPPGFSSHDLMERAFNITSSRSGSQQLDNGRVLKSQYQIPVNMDVPSSIDVEFIDPAIMAVGKGKLPMEFHHSGLDLRSQCALQSGTFDIDPRIQLLMKRSSPATQNMGFSESVGNGFSHLIDSLSNNLSMFVPTSYQQSIRGSHFGSEQESWSAIQGNSGISLLEAAESRRFGFDNHFPAYDDLRFRTPSSGDIYHRAFEK